ncbi:MAG: permease, partial [Opitutaceae bacterium]
MLAFTVTAALTTALFFGLAPALRATRLDLMAEFQGSARTLGTGRSRLSQGLMVVQIALSLVLLISTGLFLGTLRRLQQVDSGFNHRGLVLFRIDALGAGVTRANFDGLNRRVQERLERIPGVRAVTFARTPLLAQGRWSSNVLVRGFTPPPGTSTSVNMNAVAPNFFATVEMPLVLGRAFNERDDAAAPKVAIV